MTELKKKSGNSSKSKSVKKETDTSSEGKSVKKKVDASSKSKEKKLKTVPSKMPKSVKKKTEKSEEEVKIKSPKKPVDSESRTALNDFEKKKEDSNKPTQEPEKSTKVMTRAGGGIEDKKKILKERAKDLAEEKKQAGAGEGHLELVEFTLAYEKYGIESEFVREVYPLKEFTPVPCTPSFIFGITNVRGQLISVMDVKEFFGLPSKGLTDLNRTIIVQTPKMEVGILADVITGVRLVPLNDIQPTLPTLTDRRSEYLRGVTQDRLVILDIQKILSDPTILINEVIEV